MDIRNLKIRTATLKDSDFIIEAIIEAEKSGTEKCGFSNFFNLTLEETTRYLKEILEEEIDGCEFSIDSFLILEVNNIPAATVAGWQEGENSSDQPSAILKSNLLGYILPKEKMQYAASVKDVIEDIQIDRKQHSLQLEYVYCRKEFRSNGFIQKIMDYFFTHSTSKYAEIQVFGNNNAVIKLYEKMGFVKTKECISHNSKTLNYFPHNTKILMSKNL